MKTKTSNSFARRGSRSGSPTASPDGGQHDLQLARHQAQCRICRHPLRKAIEEDFLEWICPRESAQTYKFASERAIYRHAHALGLIERRRANRFAALDRIIERVGEVKVTAAAVISAIRLSAQLARESAAASRSSKKGIVLAFTGMPESDAVRPRHDADRQNTPGPSEWAQPENGSPQLLPSEAEEPDPNSRKRPSRHRQEAGGSGHTPQVNAHSGKRLPAPVIHTPPSAKPTTTPQADSPTTPVSAAAAGASRGAVTTEANQSKPAATQSQSAPADPVQNTAGREPGWPQGAGMIWPWPPGKRKIFARRAGWCCTRPARGGGPVP